MEYLPGGDLFSLMIRNNRFSEDVIQFYLAEITLALNALHTLGFVHRDIKPENILLDRLGHLKLADFGSAAALEKDGHVTSFTPVGTPDYIGKYDACEYSFEFHDLTVFFTFFHLKNSTRATPAHPLETTNANHIQRKYGNAH